MWHGESASVDIEALEIDLQSLRQTLQSYLNDDIYNMDETGLYWKARPDRTLASEEITGGKKEKARITANFCCNASGSDKLPIQFIGKAKNPRCFKNQNQESGYGMEIQSESLDDREDFQRMIDLVQQMNDWMEGSSSC